MKRIRLRDGIALAALLLAIPSFIDFMVRIFNKPDITIVAPYQVDFRTKEIVQEAIHGLPLLHEDGVHPRVDVSTADQITYAIIPISYTNSGDDGDDILVLRERIIVEIGDELIVYNSTYTTSKSHGIQSNWFGDTEPWLPNTIRGGEARAHQVVFAPHNSSISWNDFIHKLSAIRESKISIVIELQSHSGRVFRSVPCSVEVEELLHPLDRTASDRARDYYITAACRV